MKWFLLVLTLVLASCATARNSFHGDLSAVKKVAVKAEAGASADHRVQMAIESEVRQRGLTVVNQGQDLTLQYHDSWFWDFVMYLRELKLTAVRSSGEVAGSALYEDKILHGYASQESVVKKLFAELDKTGLGQKR